MTSTVDRPAGARHHETGPLPIALSAAGATALILIGLALPVILGDRVDAVGTTLGWVGIVGLCLVGLIVLVGRKLPRGR